MEENICQNEKSTFVVQVLYKQNATWQGNIKWLETGKQTNFRSAMELIQIIDAAVTKKQPGRKED